MPYGILRFEKRRGRPVSALRTEVRRTDTGVKIMIFLHKEGCHDFVMPLQCTQSKNFTKLVTRHIWENYLEIAEKARTYTKSAAKPLKGSSRIPKRNMVCATCNTEA
jgi:hydrogenase maturation factor HypF (carbamoyltransferase family)